ncbi:MAG: hypothetical protein JNL24_03805 [Bacteroidia bacterium]|nr:hypothetical protein [Bacteroidia bacterium]
MEAKIDIDLSIYESKLRGQIGSDLTALQITYDAISQPNYNNRKYILKQGFTISEIGVPPVDFLKQREINKCFKSIIGSFQDYMDNLIAILRLKAEKITIPPQTTLEEVNALLQNKFEEHLLNVSTDRSLNIPSKLKLLLDKPKHQIYKESIQSYFDIRNGLEHHKGIAKADRVIRYKRMGLASTAGYEVMKPGPLGEGEGLVLKTFDEEITFDKGGMLLITREQLDCIALSLLIFAIPTIQTATGEKFNA